MADGGRRRTLWIRGLAAAGAVTTLVAAGWARAEAAELPGAYAGEAAAAGARISFVVPGQFAVEEIVDGGGPFARSYLDSVGAASDAAFPYPGGAALAYQGFVALTGISSPFAYPAYVRASNPGTPSQEVSDPSGTYRLAVNAEPGHTAGLAQMQGGLAQAVVSGASATTSAVKNDEAITVTAENVARGIQVGKDLTLSSVRSKSVSTFRRDHSEPVTTTEFAVDGLHIGPVKFGVTPEGFVVLGQPVPTPGSAVNDQIAALLKPSGLTLRFIGAATGAEGAEAAALEIQGTSPPGPNGATGTFRLTLGGAKSSIRISESLPPVPPLDSAGSESVSPVGAPASTSESLLDPPAPVGGVQPAGAAPYPSVAGGAFPSPTLPASASSGRSAALPAEDSEPSDAAAPPTAATPELAAQPILRPKRVGSVDWLMTVLLAAGAAMVLLAGFSKRSGDTQAWAG